MGARLAAAAVLVLTLAGCGDGEKSADDEPSAPTGSSTATATEATTQATRTLPSAKPTPAIPPGTPPCADVWSGGAILPQGYKGCAVGKKYVRADVLSCSSGQGIVKYDDRFWAVRGGAISQAADIYESDAYIDTVARCRG